MTRDEFKEQSDILFFQVKESLCKQILDEAKPIFEKGMDKADSISSLSTLNTELTQAISTLCFEASCDYAEKLALLLFDNFSK